MPATAGAYRAVIHATRSCLHARGKGARKGMRTASEGLPLARGRARATLDPSSVAANPSHRISNAEPRKEFSPRSLIVDSFLGWRGAFAAESRF